MTQVSKVVALVSALGAVGGGVAVASGAFKQSEKQQVQSVVEKVNKVTISSKLASEGFEVLSTDKDGEEWGKVLTEYQKATVKIFAESREENKTQKQLREDCQKILGKEELTGDDYQLAKKWCVKKEPINAILKRGGYKTLNFIEQGDPQEKPLWIEKIKELKQNKDKFEAIKSEIKDEEDATDANIVALKKGCTGLKIDNIETTGDDFEKNLNLAKDWCSVKTDNKGK